MEPESLKSVVLWLATGVELLAVVIMAAAVVEAVVRVVALRFLPQGIMGLAARIGTFERPGSDALDSWSGLTAVGAALLEARALLERAPDCDAQTVDLAGDGISNAGPKPGALRATHFEGVTINALAVADAQVIETGATPEGGVPIAAWFRENVMHGPGAFVEEADGYPAFARAMTRKLLRELSPPLLSMADP